MTFKAIGVNFITYEVVPDFGSVHSFNKVTTNLDDGLEPLDLGEAGGAGSLGPAPTLPLVRRNRLAGDHQPGRGSATCFGGASRERSQYNN